MSVHNSAKRGDIADKILLPGDPLRAKYIAENFLDDAVCYNSVRGMLGYTGYYKGKRVSVQGTGMGIPSISIVATELITEYGCSSLLRVGSCGALQPEVKIMDIIIAQSASTDSAINKIRFGGQDYAATASFSLLERTLLEARKHTSPVHIGAVLSSDTFYADEHLGDTMLPWREFNTLAVEMEAAALFTIAAKHRVESGAILTVSDHLLTGDRLSSQERETSFETMMHIALAAI